MKYIARAGTYKLIKVSSVHGQNVESVTILNLSAAQASIFFKDHFYNSLGFDRMERVED